jgi:soluble lytic murein transglycosylase-like protein
MLLHAGSAPVASEVRPDPVTGRLVRTKVSLKPRARKPAAPPPAVLRATVEQVAAENLLPPGLIHSIIKVESNYNANAVSPKGAMGLMQLIPSTAERFGVADAFDPLENLKGGARYLRHLLALYGPDYPLVLAAYNAGEGAVARYGGVPPYPETRNYVELVKRAYEEFAPAPPPRQAARVKPAEAYNRIQEVAEPDGRVRYVSR